MNLYQALDVWKRISETRAVRYRCFKNLSSGRYCVQSADFYSVPLDSKRAAELEKQWVELFTEDPPDNRAKTFDSLEDAIEAHDRDFSSGSQT